MHSTSANATRAPDQDDRKGEICTTTQRSTAKDLGFETTGEEVLHSRWLQLSNRKIRFPARDGRPATEHEFDIVGHPKAAFSFVVVFPYHPPGPGQLHPEVTLLREFCQGPVEMMYVLPSGALDPRRHANALEAAQAELSEEAYLSGGQWVDLLPESAAGPPESKWCSNRMRSWLCIAPTAEAAPGTRDAEEFIEVHRVSIPELRRIMRSGQMMLPSVCTAYFALDELAERGLL